MKFTTVLRAAISSKNTIPQFKAFEPPLAPEVPTEKLAEWFAAYNKPRSKNLQYPPKRLIVSMTTYYNQETVIEGRLDLEKKPVGQTIWPPGTKATVIESFGLPRDIYWRERALAKQQGYVLDGRQYILPAPIPSTEEIEAQGKEDAQSKPIKHQENDERDLDDPDEYVSSLSFEEAEIAASRTRPDVVPREDGDGYDVVSCAERLYEDYEKMRLMRAWSKQGKEKELQQTILKQQGDDKQMATEFGETEMDQPGTIRMIATIAERMRNGEEIAQESMPRFEAASAEERSNPNWWTSDYWGPAPWEEPENGEDK